jgi:serine/threonine protein kinase
MGIGLGGETMRGWDERSQSCVHATLFRPAQQYFTPQRRRDIAVLHRLGDHCRHLVPLVRAAVLPDDRALVALGVPEVPVTSLRAMIDGAVNGLPEGVARSLFVSLVRGVQVCHANQIAHGRLNPRCIFVDDADDQWNLRIAGFGLTGRALP